MMDHRKKTKYMKHAFFIFEICLGTNEKAFFFPCSLGLGQGPTWWSHVIFLGEGHWKPKPANECVNSTAEGDNSCHEHSYLQRTSTSTAANIPACPKAWSTKALSAMLNKTPLPHPLKNVELVWQNGMHVEQVEGQDQISCWMLSAEIKVMRQLSGGNGR